MLTRRFVLLIAAIVLAAWFAPQSFAQPMLINPAQANGPAQGNGPAEPGTPPPAQPTTSDKRAENSEQLRVAMRKLEANGGSDSAAAQEVAFRQSRDAVLTQQDAVEQQIKDSQTRRAELESQLNSPPPVGKLYKFADLDRLKDDVAAARARASMIEDKLTSAKATLEKAEAALADTEVRRRQAQTAYDGNKDAPNATELGMAVERAKQEAALAAEVLALRKREVHREELSREFFKLVIRVRKEQIERISPQVKFTDADLQEQIATVKKKEDSANTALTRAQAELQSAEVEVKNTQQQLDAATGESRTVLTEVVAARRRSRDKCYEEIESLQLQLKQLAQIRLAWSRRYEIANANLEGADSAVWGKWKDIEKETERTLDTLESDLRNQIFKMSETRSTASFINKKAEAASKGPPEVVMSLGIQQQRLDETLKLYEKNLVTIENSRRIHEKLLDEIGTQVEIVTPKAIALGVWYQVELVWNKELMAIGDNPISVGRAIKCLTIFVLGWMMSRFTSGFFANRFLKRFRLSKDATSAIRSLVFYSLLFFFSLTALKSINIDLTAFTILGGGLAIGVGFGSQTLINNFIGGLIMLAERPVRLGERITFKDMDGVVEDVGFRCTKLRTPSDHLVTIPNSTLVNESIENIDRRRTIRRTFTVAVTYNISHDLLAEGVQTIREILEERDIRERIHPIVGFEEISPKVHFSDFAAESLNIQITYCYAPVDTTAFAEHSERVNFRIMEEFDRLGIDFAFPSKTPYVKNKKNDGRLRGDSFAA